MRRILMGVTVTAVFLTGVGVFGEDSTSTYKDSLFLTLEDAQKISMEQNQTILIAKERLIEKQAGIGTARAGFLPSISFQGSYTRLGKIPAFSMAIPQYTLTPLGVYDILGNPIGYTDPVMIMTGVDSMELEMGKSENYLFRGSLQQPLFTWGTLLNSYRIASISLEIERENYNKTENEVRLQVTQSFLGTVLVQQTLDLMEESYAQMQRHLEQVEKLYENGMAERLDFLRARVELSNIHTQVVRVRGQMDIATSALKSLLALPQDVELILEEGLEYEPYEIGLEEAMKIAVEKRPEIIAMRLTKEMTEKALSIERARNKPKLALVYNYDYKKPLRMMENEWGTDWNITLALSMPIFQGGSYISKVKQKKAQLKQMEYGLSQFEDAVRLDVKSCWLAVQQEKEILAYQEENVSRAEEALKLAEEKYRNGMITNLEYMDIQLVLTRAKLEWVSSIANYNIAMEKLIVAMGG
ncbi:MAG: hypothetical protein COX49_03055 [bacterium (Candidatus Stahlbacteria) CG23_combo_of_CG06-09_8_20_14_all_40_9]|nr:MAG: hypothetical protein COX49_03055 [bacterium (Candidatus Stahlbacteria) CG23_combo_of_CG06-09_8_20_14_all_40_9]